MKRISAISSLLTLSVLAACSSAVSDPAEVLTYDEAVEQVNAYVESDKVEYTRMAHEPDNSWVGVDTSVTDLPDIENYPLSVEGRGDIVVTIASSTEKSHVNGDRWFDRMAEEFNDSGVTIDGRSVAVSIQPMASGVAHEYITSGAYIPDAVSPSNELWLPLIEASGVETLMIQDRLAGNTAGILMSDEVHAQFVESYGAVTVESAIDAVMAGDLTLGHSDPNISSTGLNMLLQELQVMDAANLLSPEAVEAFRTFQAKVPAPALTTEQLSLQAAKGLADATIMESQAYNAEPSLTTGWVFTPFGVRHDNPLVALGDTTTDEQQALELFAEFVSTDEAQRVASDFGFNQYDDYSGVENMLSGAQISGALGVWKANKDAGVPLVSMIVVDRSGSMYDSNKIEQARQALLAGAGEISTGNYVGLVSYASDITVDVPIGQFTDQQRSLFVGAVNNMVPEGGTATNSAIVAALNEMLAYEVEADEVKYRIILISDGATNEGLRLDAALEVVGGLGVAIYSVSFETDASLNEMQALASVGRESASVITANSEDVTMLFRNMARNAL